jgi:acyl-CoA synthetase (AMP-forming)/AMP-acid ligase II
LGICVLVLYLNIHPLKMLIAVSHAPASMNIIEPMLFQCKLNPLALAICVPGSPYGSVTYGMLERFIQSTAQMAVKSGVTPGNVVAIYIAADTVLHLALILGLTHIGAVTLSLRAPRLVPGIKPDLVLTDVPGQISGDATVLGIDRSWLAGEGSAAERAPLRGGGDDTCRIILTSGSTGVSKGIALSHRVMAERTASYTTLRGPRFAHCARFFCDIGLSTSPGIHYAMSLLGRGATIYFLGAEPADILQTINLHGIQGMGTSPYGLGEFLKFFEADSAFDVTFDHVICQGAMLVRELSQRARARICQNLYSSYGATETSTVAFGPASVTERTAGAVGYLQPGVTLQAIDNSGRILPPQADGLLRIRSHQTASEYVGDPEATRTFFRDGYFYTGDIGHVTNDGLLVITGREKTALNIGGETITPERVEDVIAAFAGIREAGVFARNNELGIAELHALIVTTSPIDNAALLRHCAGRLPRSCVPISVIIVDALPRGGQGKLERHRFPDIAAAKTRIVESGDYEHR